MWHNVVPNATQTNEEVLEQGRWRSWRSEEVCFDYCLFSFGLLFDCFCLLWEDFLCFCFLFFFLSLFGGLLGDRGGGEYGGSRR